MKPEYLFNLHCALHLGGKITQAWLHFACLSSRPDTTLRHAIDFVSTVLSKALLIWKVASLKHNLSLSHITYLNRIVLGTYLFIPVYMVYKNGKLKLLELSNFSSKNLVFVGEIMIPSQICDVYATRGTSQSNVYRHYKPILCVLLQELRS